jgi:4-oxalocrotonate tautomerase
MHSASFAAMRRAEGGTTMPFVNIQILKGHSKKRKDEMASRVVDAISELAKLPRDAVWVVFEDVAADDWYLGGRSVRKIKSGKT